MKTTGVKVTFQNSDFWFFLGHPSGHVCLWSIINDDVRCMKTTLVTSMHVPTQTPWEGAVRRRHRRLRWQSPGQHLAIGKKATITACLCSVTNNRYGLLIFIMAYIVLKTQNYS